MKLRSEVSAEKLRGGFYTPTGLVEHAIQRLRKLVPTREMPLRVLEPGVGDGAFIAGLDRAGMPVAHFTGIDVDEDAVRASRQRLLAHGISGEILHTSTLTWSLNTPNEYDVVIGNLPFVRFQFVPDRDRVAALQHGDDLSVPVAGVANLWLPMLLASIRRLRLGGAFSLVLPAESFTGISAGKARAWLLRNATNLQFDLYPPKSFPGALQEVVLLSGLRSVINSAKKRPVTVSIHSSQHSTDSFDADLAWTTKHSIPVNGSPWTHLLLRPDELDAFHEARALPCAHALSEVAKFEVATVTGANAYFSLSDGEVHEFGLGPWTRPLLARAKHAPGLRFSEEDYKANVAANVKAYLFDASRAAIDRRTQKNIDDYLSQGEEAKINERFKCRIRDPWYQVPGMKRGDLMLSKRCHYYPRVISNDTEAITTDTIYRGRMLRDSITKQDFVASFHNSLTLLSAELEGRNFGGGVLELVPSEVGRLTIVSAPGMSNEFDRLDAICRESAGSDTPADPEALVHESDLLLSKMRLGLTSSLLDRLRAAHLTLQRRRLDRATT